MKIKPKQYAISLFESLDGANEKRAKEIIEKFVQVLVENNQASQIEKIIKYFENLWNKENSLVEAEIVSARELDKSVIKLLNNYIIELSDAKKVNIKEKVDKSILGGVVIKYGDKILDSSLKNKLGEFRSSLKSN